MCTAIVHPRLPLGAFSGGRATWDIWTAPDPGLTCCRVSGSSLALLRWNLGQRVVVSTSHEPNVDDVIRNVRETFEGMTAT
jgi:hypothetical protein